MFQKTEAGSNEQCCVFTSLQQQTELAQLRNIFSNTTQEGLQETFLKKSKSVVLFFEQNNYTNNKLYCLNLKAFLALQEVIKCKF